MTMCVLGYDPYKEFWQEVDTVYENLEWLADFHEVSKPIVLSKQRVWAYRRDRFALAFIPRFSMVVGILSAIIPLMVVS